ncbi:Gfo/Idh/MocA family protein [Sphingomonas jatrophae]|uniref:Predicted dehydrogenase n=1 Tax=Sphingomonas jatrophae TaxID=1166337 RepID=A0A1I6KH22_9SPHN|nr:Gfo/Idh/MocA family oxidoreductase [Sphingomonas jatrophae]SFR90529.1 Predicted dehydrogenase [Sphingomonas jatrophae]
MSEPIGAVVVGTGFGLFAHVRALREAGLEVRAIVGRDLAKTQARAAPLGIPRAVNRLGDALDDPAIRLVTVATPPHAHYPAVMEAIAAGRHVVCEKPFARDLAQAREMLAAAEAAGIVHLLGAEFRFDSAQALLRRVVKDGRIGDPLSFLRIYHQPGLQDPDEPLAEWWEDAGQGGGFLGAFGSHMIDQVQSALGRIERVSAVLQTLAPGRPQMTADDSYTLQFVTESGAKGLLVAAMAAPGPLVMATKLVGTGGAAWIQSGAAYGEPEEVWIERGGKAERVETPADLVNPPPTPFPHAELIQTEMDRWHTSGFDVAPYARLFAEAKARIEEREPAIPERAGTFRDAAEGQAVLDAARRSSADGAWVEVERV